MRKAVAELFLGWLGQNMELEEEQKKVSVNYVYRHYRDIKEIIEAYGALQKEEDYQSLELSLENKGGTLKIGNQTVAEGKHKIKELLEVMTEAVQDILPLGTVVELKQEEIPKEQREGKGALRVVITRRFLEIEGETEYLPYSGVLYPVGAISQEQQVYFTGHAVKNILHRGYSDESELAYVLHTKEIILQKRLRSIMFLEEEYHDKISDSK